MIRVRANQFSQPLLSKPIREAFMLAFLKMPVTAKKVDYEEYSDPGSELQEHVTIWRLLGTFYTECTRLKKIAVTCFFIRR